jgi:hypothetical protein
MKTLFRSQRMLLLVAGLILTTTTLLLFSAVSSALVVQVEDDLQAYWRTTYDILVRPSGSQSALERQHGLVEANYLSQIEGGISWEQYQTIANLPDIEVVAPVALLTYIQDRLPDGTTLPQPETDGIYRHETIMATDGLQIGPELVTGHRYITYHYRGADAANQNGSRDIVVNQPVVPMGVSVRLLLAAVDPAAEADLIGLDQALRDGLYLSGAEAVYTDTMSSPLGTAVRYNDIPILLNATPYASLTLHHRLAQVQLPPDVTSLANIMEQGGVDYLENLPATTIVEQETSIRDAYPQFIDNLWQPRSTGSTVQVHSLNQKSEQPLTRHYRPIASPFPEQELVLEFLPRPLPSQEALAGRERVFTLKAYGVFDIEQIPPPPDVNRVPLEIYYPPVVLLRYDEQGRPVAQRPLQPMPGPTSYVLSPPLMLTTMEAAQAISGGCADCINAIRVRVAGIDELTPAAQRKIEAIASDITHQTGLDVDIMVGSSPTRLLVLVPGLGYVEEQWIQKNVTTSYQEQVQVGHWLLLATLLGIGGLFVLDLAWADVVARRRIIALQKALGWRSSSVFAQVLGQILLAAVVAAVLSLPLAAALIWLLDWTLPSVAWLVGVPLLVVLLSLLGGLYPAWLAARVPPIIGLQHGNIQPAAVNRSGSSFFSLPSSFFLLAWRGLTRRWHRSLLGALTAALSAALLVLLLSVTMDQQGALSGTLLGEFILVRIEGYHYALVAIGFALAALSLANSLLAGVLERRREIGVLKATGWRTETVTRLFVAEGSLLGLLGGLLGVLGGVAFFTAVYQSLSANLLWISLVGLLLPVLVGSWAALYPARVAARVPPAEAVRYE